MFSAASRLDTYFRNTTLHNQEIWVIDVQLNTLEKGLNGVLCRLMAIEEVFRDVGYSNLQVQSQG